MCGLIHSMLVITPFNVTVSWGLNSAVNEWCAWRRGANSNMNPPTSTRKHMFLITILPLLLGTRVSSEIEWGAELEDASENVAVVREVLHMAPVFLGAVRSFFDFVVSHPLQIARPLHPRFGEHDGILDGDRLVQAVAVTAKARHHVCLVAEEGAVVGQPCRVVQVGDIDDERVAFPTTDRVAVS